MEPPVLIFVQSKSRAKELFQELVYEDISVDVIHADRTQQQVGPALSKRAAAIAVGHCCRPSWLQRDDVVKQFREGKVWVLICTDLMGRGVDFKVGCCCCKAVQAGLVSGKAGHVATVCMWCVIKSCRE